MNIPKIIICYGGNRRVYNIIHDRGMLYGSRLPGKPYGQIYFADQDYKNPVKDKYVSFIEKYKPVMSTVLDIIYPEDLEVAISWSEEISPYVEKIVFIPKLSGIIDSIPRHINNVPTLLGFSVPTLYGGTFVPLREFRSWDVHLLGGKAEIQWNFWLRLSECGANVFSLDHNYCMKISDYGRIWTGKLDGYDTWETRTASGTSKYSIIEQSLDNLIRFWEYQSHEN